ncbi:sigma 54-interacting transcriptional regulator [candidate division KSB1 bacterium]|nr:sigma 54-interacting transcriptional regulator [candidate division KSB1 bacterium]
MAVITVRDARILFFFLLSIFFNVVDSMPDGGRILISTRLVQIFAASDDGKIGRDFSDCRIQDAGCGIPEEFLAQVTDAYFTLKSGGTGLGLAVLTGRKALACLEKEMPDAILLDLLLTDRDGLELAQEILASSVDLPIILISAHGFIEKAVAAIKVGVYDFIEKPFSRERIVVTVRKAVAWYQNRRELSFFRDQLEGQSRMVGESPALQQVRDLIDKIAPTNSPVLIHGESGVGKELVAHALRHQSRRRDCRLEKMDCPGIPETLMESELFGHVRGAFTGAHRNHNGRIHQANHSICFWMKSPN